MKTKTDNLNEIVLLPLGGVNEVGMNLTLYGFGPKHKRQWIMVDCGIGFSQDFPGVEVILPDTAFIEEQKENLCGIFITHGHEDHLGALLDLWPFLESKVYAPPFAAALLRQKQIDGNYDYDLPIQVCEKSERIQAGPFEVELVTVNHSIPECFALAIRVGGKCIFHSGDWKLDEHPYGGEKTDEKRLKEIGQDGVHALICDSTNAGRTGESPTESDVARNLVDVVAKASGRVVVTLFSSNINRVRAIYDAALEDGRSVAVAGRAIARNISLAQELDLLPKSMRFVSPGEFNALPPKKTLVLATGSQGEWRASLARIAAQNHPFVSLDAGDTVVFSSRTIPGNEASINRIVNALIVRGIHIVNDQTAPIHVSGHPRQNELKKLYGWIKPDILVPVHGEPWHIEQQRKWASQCGIKNIMIPYNGHVMRLGSQPLASIDYVQSGILLADGDVLVEPADQSIRTRRKLAYAGQIVVVLSTRSDGDFRPNVQVVVSGIPVDLLFDQPIEKVVEKELMGVLKGMAKKERSNKNKVCEALRRSIINAIRAQWDKKPICTVLVAD